MKVVWTKTSELTLDEIVDYIRNKFGDLVAEKHYFDVLETIDDIKINPELFPIYQENTETRKAVINKKTILYYTIHLENINLLAFYDVRKGTHKL
jgi:plasmid stabilization system protein ParE